MEPNVATDMIKGKPDDSFQIGAVSSDLDSTLSARIKNEIGRSVEKLIDSNHLTKTLHTQLYQLKETHKELSTTVIAYLKRCFIYAVKQSDSVEEISDAITNIVNHVYGNHTNCKKWCNFSEDPENYKHKSLPRGKDLKGEDLRKALKELFGAYSANSQKLRKLGSTQSNESFNVSVASFAPKSRHYSASESLDFRVGTAVCKKNLGPKYSLHVLKQMNLPVTSFMDSKLEAASETERKRKLTVSSKEFKKRRLMLKEKRRSSNELNQLQEGDTYASGIELRNDKEVEDEIIPTYVPLPSDERIKQAENLLFVSVDFGNIYVRPRCRSNSVICRLPIWI